MSKLFKLKQWLTLDEAATYLSSAMSEPVSKVDILRLALDSELVLSVYFVGKIKGKLGKAVPRSEAPRVPGIPVKGMSPYEVILGMRLNDAEVLLFENPLRYVEGVFDLPMIGGERITCEALYQRLTNGPEVDLSNIDGAFLRIPESDSYVQLHEEYLPPPKLGDTRNRWERREDLTEIPLGSLPDDAVFVVRRESLLAFLDGLENESSGEKPLSTRERNTLLTIIAALCKEAKIDHTKPAKAAGIIQSTADQMGLNIGESTIEGHLKKIPNALGTRMK